MHLTLEFGGGLELLLEKSTKVHTVVVEPKAGEDKVTMRGLLSWVKSNLIKERPEMFMKGDSVRPGVLVLINDCDWELCDGLDAELEEKDTGSKRKDCSICAACPILGHELNRTIIHVAHRGGGPHLQLHACKNWRTGTHECIASPVPLLSDS